MSMDGAGLPSVLPADVLAELKETAQKLCAPGAKMGSGQEQANMNMHWLRIGDPKP